MTHQFEFSCHLTVFARTMVWNDRINPLVTIFASITIFIYEKYTFFNILYLSKTVTHHIQLDQLMTNENNVKIEKKDDLIIINIFTGSQSWNRRLHGQTIQPNRKLMSMNLFKILCVVTWAWLFLTSMVMKAVRGQKRYSERTLWHTLTQCSVHPTVPVLLTRRNKK